jgi:hypothetical protein
VARAVKFDIGDVRVLPCPAGEDIPRLARLPHPLCYFEFDMPAADQQGSSIGHLRVMVLARDLGGQVASVFFRSHPRGDRLFSMGYGARWTVEAGDLVWTLDLLTAAPPTDLVGIAAVEEQTAAFLRPLLAYLALLNRPGTRVKRERPAGPVWRNSRAGGYAAAAA